MNNKTVEHKLSVFISSKCGNEYEIMRKALKHLLLETGLTDVYCFEAEPGSSESMPSAYLDQIDCCQLFILIVDNSDGISDATLAEYKRARELGKRIIAIFCSEKSVDKTEIEKEIIEQQICKYITVPYFSDIASRAYQSVIQDLINVYKKKKELNSSEPTVDNGDSLVKINDPNVYVKKELLSNFDNVGKTLINTIFPDFANSLFSSELDELSCWFLKVVLCKEKFDLEKFSLLKSFLLEKHSEPLNSIINIRLDAVSSYFFGDLDECINKLNQALTMSLESTLIPKWICNDIAIDLRNMINKRANINGNYLPENKGQMIIDQSDEFLFFPSIDRLASNIKGSVIDEYKKIELQSPYTTTFGGIESNLEYISPYFCIALLYGSITHLRMTSELIIDVLQVLTQEYSNPELNSELIRLLVLNCDDKTLEDLTRTYNKPYSIVSFIEIQKIIADINNLSFEHEISCVKLVLLKYFGYYFSDEQFNDITKWFLDYINIQYNKQSFSHIDLIKKLFINNCERMPPYIICNYIQWLFSYGSIKSVSTACELLRFLPFSKISKKSQIELRKSLRKVIENDCDVPNLKGGILAFCLNSSVETTSIENLIKKRMHRFYENDYYLEMYIKDKKASIEYIHKLIKDIYSRIEIQGNPGFIGFSDNPFATIKNIIKENNIKLNEEELSDVVQAVYDFLISPNQIPREKVYAIRLLIYLLLVLPRTNSTKKIIIKLINAKDEIFKVYSDDFFEKTSVSSLMFAYNFLLLFVDEYDVEQVVSNIAKIESMRDADIITCLSLISSLSDVIDYRNYSDEITISLFQLCISLQDHKERDIKYLSTKCLTSLTNSKYTKLVLKALSECMDYENSEIKIAIIRQLKNFNCDSTIKDYIIQKASIDNNYLVRIIALSA